MFKFLRDKIKKAVGSFSKKAEEEGEKIEEPIEEKIEDKVVEEKETKEESQDPDEKEEFSVMEEKTHSLDEKEPVLEETEEPVSEIKEPESREESIEKEKVEKVEEKRKEAVSESKLPMSRDQAFELVKKYNSDPQNINHYLESEVIMRFLARKLGEDEEYWGMLGLLHDIDWELTKDDDTKHLTKAPEMLKKAGFDDKFIQIIVSHGYGFHCAGLQDKKRTEKTEFALACSETMTGLIYAYALMRGGMEGMQVKGLKKKFKDKSFAATVNRSIIKECENLSLSLDDFFQLSIEAVTSIADQIGIAKVEKEPKAEEKIVDQKVEEKEKTIEKIKEETQPLKEKEPAIKETVEPESEIREAETKAESVEEEKEESLVDSSEETETEEKPKKRSLFGKFRESITKVRISEKKFDDIFWELELSLMENNVAVDVIEKIKSDLKSELIDKPLPMGKINEKIIKSLKDSIEEILSFETFDIVEKIKKSDKPYVILMLGINGTGKTTTIAKMVNMFEKNNLTAVVAASDTFRAAAIDQLQEHCDKLNVKMIKHDYGADPAAVAFDAIKFAKAKARDAVIIDTAGRMHSNVNLMDELKKIIRVSNPDLKLFIGDALTGNDCVEQAQMFDEAADIDGIIINKADADEKGGTALSVAYVTKKPLLYLGVGQTYDDIERFNKEKILNMLGF